MNKILISGYYGFKNLGDEAILETITKNLKNSLKDIDITVLSANPKVTSKKYNVKSVDRKNILYIIKELLNTDLLISGGGSLLQDITSKRSITYYLGIIALGLLLRKKIMVYSQGIGPINKDFHKILTKILLNRVDYITVRDYNSKKDLIDIGVSADKIEVTADPVMSLASIGKEKGLEILRDIKPNFDSQRPTIGIAFRGKNYNSNIKEVLIKTINELISKIGSNIILIPFHNSEDMTINQDIKDKVNKNVIFLNNRYSSEETLSIFENLDLLIGVRLHSLIFSAVANVPMIGISYDPKIDYFMDTLNQKSLCKIDDLTSEILLNQVFDLLDNKKAHQELINHRVKDLKKTISKNEEIVKMLLAKGEE